MDENYNDLINAVIIQAIKDYEEEYYRTDVEVFLKGEWFKSLTDIDGEKLLEELEKRVKEKESEKQKKKSDIERIKRGYEQSE